MRGSVDESIGEHDEGACSGTREEPSCSRCPLKRRRWIVSRWIPVEPIHLRPASLHEYSLFFFSAIELWKSLWFDCKNLLALRIYRLSELCNLTLCKLKAIVWIYTSFVIYFIIYINFEFGKVNIQSTVNTVN